jgi:hypothetical protein
MGGGSGASTQVYTLTTLPGGDLIAGGNFTTAGGVPANFVARWNGSIWSALGSGMTGGNFTVVNSLITLPSGDLIAGGQFTTAGDVFAPYLARWGCLTPSCDPIDFKTSSISSPSSPAARVRPATRATTSTSTMMACSRAMTISSRSSACSRVERATHDL